MSWTLKKLFLAPSACGMWMHPGKQLGSHKGQVDENQNYNTPVLNLDLWINIV
jgi:hypothetical protein